jgi:sigma-E factor negative regulatory protein RseB
VLTLSYHPTRQHGRDGRSPLLLAAALVMAVPGFLATACSAPADSGASGSDATAAASRSPAVADPAPVTDPAPAGRRQSSSRALRLLTQAAQAAVLTSYQGEEIVTRWSNGSGSMLVSDVWHVSGGQTITQTLAAGSALSSQPYLSADNDGQQPEGVLGVTVPLIQLLEAHYIVAYAGAGSADSRTAQVVEAWRTDGSLAARFWLDDATKLPLEREVFDSGAHVISQDVFIKVHVAANAPVAVPSADGPADPPGPWTDPLSRAQLLALHAQGWLVPARLPGGLALFTGARTTTGTGSVLDLGYSDGLSVISVFEQRGDLAAKLAGWQKTIVAGHAIYIAEPDQRSLTWASHDMVYTVMADAPAQTVDAVVGALPHDGPPGFWKRMSRGFVRLASWVNPFR